MTTLSNHPRIKIEIIIPLGVVFIMMSTVQLTHINTSSVVEDMLPALLLWRGLGIGLLNTAVTISVLLSFSRETIAQGVCYFYLIRTLGGLASTALFSHLFSVEMALAINILGENFNPLNDYLYERIPFARLPLF